MNKQGKGQNQKSTEPWVEVLGEVKKLGGGVKKLGDKIDHLENRFDGLEDRLDGLEGRFDGLETKVDKLGVRMGNVEDRLENLEVVVDDLSHSMKSNFETVFLFLSKADPAELQERVVKIEKKLEMR